MKTKEELNALKNEVETLNKKLADLTEEEIAQVTGGSETEIIYTCDTCGKQFPSLDALARHSRLHIIAYP